MVIGAEWLVTDDGLRNAWRLVDATLPHPVPPPFAMDPVNNQSEFLNDPLISQQTPIALDHDLPTLQTADLAGALLLDMAVQDGFVFDVPPNVQAQQAQTSSQPSQSSNMVPMRLPLRLRNLQDQAIAVVFNEQDAQTSASQPDQDRNARPGSARQVPDGVQLAAEYYVRTLDRPSPSGPVDPTVQIVDPRYTHGGRPSSNQFTLPLRATTVINPRNKWYSLGDPSNNTQDVLQEVGADPDPQLAHNPLQQPQPAPANPAAPVAAPTNPVPPASGNVTAPPQRPWSPLDRTMYQHFPRARITGQPPTLPRRATDEQIRQFRSYWRPGMYLPEDVPRHSFPCSIPGCNVLANVKRSLRRHYTAHHKLTNANMPNTNLLFPVRVRLVETVLGGATRYERCNSPESSSSSEDSDMDVDSDGDDDDDEHEGGQPPQALLQMVTV